MGLQKLIVLVKAPRPGWVKTRLASGGLGFEGAANAYRSLVRDLLGTLAPLDGVELRFAPDDAGAEIAGWLKPSWTASPQGEGDLGGRLARAFDAAFAAGADRVLVIGSDCPFVELADLAEAWEALHTHDVVIGPAADGGYWLVGLRQSQPALFQNMPWSTSRVFELTEQRAQQSGLFLHLCRVLGDVDSIEDWEAYTNGRP